MLLQLLANGLANGCQFALLALSFALIYNTTRIFHVAHGAVYTWAAYLCYLFLVPLRMEAPAGIMGSLLITSLLGVAIDRLTYRPLLDKGASLLVALLSSLGLYVTMINLLILLFGNEPQVLRPGLQRMYHWGAVVLTDSQCLEILTDSALAAMVLLLLRKTNLGMKIRALRDDPTLTAVMGINRFRIHFVVFALGSLLIAVPSVLAAMEVGIDPNAGLSAFLTCVVALIIGGAGSFEGAVAGGMILGLLQGIVIWMTSARWRDAITFAILILFLLLRPHGLLGRRGRMEEAAT